MKSLNFTINNNDLLDYKKKSMARKLVSRYIKLGKLHRSTMCELCSETKLTQAHHTDYGRPLDVMWLCDACHGSCHRTDSIYNPKNIYQTPMPLLWDMREGVTISFTLPAKNFIAIKKYCKNENKTLSKVIRQCVLDKYRVDDDQLKLNFEGDDELVAEI
ncbi:MAG: hypothetical protein QXF82_07890 [Nitrososphaeria archaeon]